MTTEYEDRPRNARAILDAIEHGERYFRDYNTFCDRVDEIYSARAMNATEAMNLALSDQEYDLFWASMEILKPAIYAKPPRIVCRPRFSDANATDKMVGEVVERVLNSEFERSCMDQVMLSARDDLALLNRGVVRVTLEDGDLCIDHVEREDYLHEPARKWKEVGWEAYRAWLTREDMADRFDGIAWESADFQSRGREEGCDEDDGTEPKAAVWEFWDRKNDRVYWVSEGVEEFLDDDEPYLDIDQFFPSPRPAYGTIRRKSLIPIPDYRRYAGHLEQINIMTARIYALLDRVKMKGLIAAGGDVGQAVETAMADTSDSILIPVPGAALLAGAGASQLVQWIPLQELAVAIQGLIEARTQLIQDFYQLSGISDIMRGATEADETLGAQRLKSQFGSIRVKDKIDELVRMARDTARIAAEIVCDNYDQKKMLDIAQIHIPTKREITKAIRDLEEAAKGELEALTEKVQQAAQQQQDPEQAQQVQKQFQEAQQQIIAKYQPQLQKLQQTVVVEDVMDVIKDRRARNLIIDIETDSTVMVDEMQSQEAATNLLSAVSNSMAALQPLMAAGEAGAKFAGAMLKSTVSKFNPSREVDTLLDEFVDAAPEMAANMAQQQGNDQGLAEANKMLAEAENTKAQAAVANVKAKSAQDQANNQIKMQELQQKAQDAAAKYEAENNKLKLQLADMQEKAANTAAETEARVNNLEANTAKILASIGLDVRKQDLEEYRAANEQQSRQVGQAMAIEGQQTEQAFRADDAERAHRGEERADRQQDFSEQSSDRQMTLAEQQAQREGNE